MLIANATVASGVDWLNENGPAEWWDRIDLETLSLSDSRRCILGQVYAPDADTIGVQDGYVFTQTLFTEHGGLPADNDPAEHWAQWITECGFITGRATREEWADAIRQLRVEVNA